MRFQGRRAVVTGGLSGIGEAVAKRIAAEGGKVVVWDMQGGIRTDISSWESVQAAAAETVKQLGGIDVLVNSAGIAGPTATVLDLKIEDWHRTIAINLDGRPYADGLAEIGVGDGLEEGIGIAAAVLELKDVGIRPVLNVDTPELAVIGVAHRDAGDHALHVVIRLLMHSVAHLVGACLALCRWFLEPAHDLAVTDRQVNC